MADTTSTSEESPQDSTNAVVVPTSADSPVQFDDGAEVATDRVVESRRGSFGVHGSPDVSGYGGLVVNVALPQGTERPYGSWFDDIADQLIDVLGEKDYNDTVEQVVIYRDQMTIWVKREKLVEFFQTMRDDPVLRFEAAMGVSGVHWPNDKGRELHAVYQLRSYTHNRLVCVEVACPDEDPHIPSGTGVYPGLDWHERETYDFFGIIFDGHPHLTRIQMPDDWPGHPQRKDYPLGGIPVEYKGATTPPPNDRRAYS